MILGLFVPLSTVCEGFFLLLAYDSSESSLNEYHCPMKSASKCLSGVSWLNLISISAITKVRSLCLLVMSTWLTEQTGSKKIKESVEESDFQTIESF